MLLDIITFVLIIKAQDELAARQLLKELTYCSDEGYQTAVVLKGVGLCGQAGKAWVLGLY